MHGSCEGEPTDIRQKSAEGLAPVDTPRNDIGFGTIELYFQTRDDVKIWIIENQFGRRNLQPYTKTNLALQLEPLIAAKAKANQVASGGDRKSVLQKSVGPIEKVDTQKVSWVSCVHGSMRWSRSIAKCR